MQWLSKSLAWILTLSLLSSDLCLAATPLTPRSSPLSPPATPLTTQALTPALTFSNGLWNTLRLDGPVVQIAIFAALAASLLMQDSDAAGGSLAMAAIWKHGKKRHRQKLLKHYSDLSLYDRSYRNALLKYTCKPGTKTAAFGLNGVIGEWQVTQEGARFHLYPNVLGELNHLKDKGIQLLVWTQLPRSEVKEIFAQHPALEDIFPHRITRENFVFETWDELTKRHWFDGFLETYAAPTKKKRREAFIKRLQALYHVDEDGNVLPDHDTFLKDAAQIGVHVIVDNDYGVQEGLNRVRTLFGQDKKHPHNFEAFIIDSSEMIRGMAKNIMDLLKYVPKVRRIPLRGTPFVDTKTNLIPEPDKLRPSHFDKFDGSTVPLHLRRQT